MASSDNSPELTTTLKRKVVEVFGASIKLSASLPFENIFCPNEFAENKPCITTLTKRRLYSLSML